MMHSYIESAAEPFRDATDLHQRMATIHPVKAIYDFRVINLSNSLRMIYLLQRSAVFHLSMNLH